jgi:hypothetical protein
VEEEEGEKKGIWEGNGEEGQMGKRKYEEKNRRIRMKEGLRLRSEIRTSRKTPYLSVLVRDTIAG